MGSLAGAVACGPSWRRWCIGSARCRCGGDAGRSAALFERGQLPGRWPPGCRVLLCWGGCDGATPCNWRGPEKPIAASGWKGHCCRAVRLPHPSPTPPTPPHHRAGAARRPCSGGSSSNIRHRVRPTRRPLHARRAARRCGTSCSHVAAGTQLRNSSAAHQLGRR